MGQLRLEQALRPRLGMASSQLALPPGKHASGNGQQNHQSEHCRQATQPLGGPCLYLGSFTLCTGYPCLYLGSLTLGVGAHLLRLSQPTCIVQFTLMRLFLALELSLALGLAGVEKCHRHIEMCTVACRP